MHNRGEVDAPAVILFLNVGTNNGVSTKHKEIIRGQGQKNHKQRFPKAGKRTLGGLLLIDDF